MTQHVSAIKTEPSAPSLGRFRRWLANAPRGHFWIYFSAATLFGFGLSVYYFLFNIYLVGCGLTGALFGLVGWGLLDLLWRYNVRKRYRERAGATSR